MKKIKKVLKLVSNNPLISTIVGGVVVLIIGTFIGKYFEMSDNVVVKNKKDINIDTILTIDTITKEIPLSEKERDSISETKESKISERTIELISDANSYFEARQYNEAIKIYEKFRKEDNLCLKEMSRERYNQIIGLIKKEDVIKASKKYNEFFKPLISK